uniref:ER membrane protein complex subunit 6 isoform X1 n=2 Tax=Doryrhamphus excisus TaxID=161450 RepID=UPI0025AE3B99|nr:ER membrane protein complex subunit 6 isoform X1 [Doryrhamphus excisus]
MYTMCTLFILNCELLPCQCGEYNIRVLAAHCIVPYFELERTNGPLPVGISKIHLPVTDNPGAKMAAVVAKREGPQFISEVAMRGNAAVLDYCRTSVSALSGATAGILGLTGLYGFIFYLLSSFLLSLLLILKAGRRWNKCFKSRRLLFTGGLVGGLFTYVLFWTFLYGMVHVY